MSFQQNIKQWIDIDNQIKTVNETLNELKKQKCILLNEINTYIETNQLSNASVTVGDERLRFVKVKETQSLTFKYLETCLSEIIKNEDQVKKIIEYIKNKREVKYVSEIKRFYNN